MRSLICLFMVALSAFSPNSTATVLASKCPLYSSADFSSQIVKYEENDYYLLQDQTVEVILTEGDFVLVKTEEDVQGYVYKYYLTENTELETYPVFNCSVRDNSLIYDLEKNATTYVAKKGSRVFIFNGFDKVDGFTEVIAVLEDGSTYCGLIKSADLKPDGINRGAIIAIPVILAGITVVLSIALIGRKKKKRRKKVAV